MFYIVTKELAKIALLNGLIIKKNNIISEENIIAELNKKAFEKNSAVLLKITDKTANIILEKANEVFVEPEDVELVDIEDDIKDEVIKNSYKEITSMVKLASLQIEKKIKSKKAVRQIFLIQALNKVGYNAS